MYANQHGIVMSSFLASPGLKKVKEEDETQEEEQEELRKYEIKQNSLNSQNEQEFVSDKNDLKVRFSNNISPLKEELEENSGGSHTDETQLIDAKLYRIQENPDYYVNEGVSRL
ncbi:hypothetical protein DOY81_004560 [Sarcophaga bullata]|nr:hypothetical protein DOY81_004560 [Sarcophaga bullata]